ncbi:hypothetical protein TVAG_195870 [Trichomonas vaginalis G3]|uniref:Uncharacterized protein n=1 Tax=Trichomonas vaginalis (strain ATCC PRA-98 / G3) TaxID=412133 RepID=A2ETM6_TRIV3|nr:armadillo (ARM) repeat-containing protein family [Trichomonas vaginalis G3]EAY03994.1 hypothetical protein TVAG_195870 [Trichomonas vaginalis G3]KAI5534908.1 armadillo (ARM) repeat-containing protein family [Trichomonas vaginalis G3]|eukprot:XP_001316217.1 hypothetical protein [Trichomonas vaginalis G3]
MEEVITSNTSIASMIIDHLKSIAIRFNDPDAGDPISREEILHLILNLIIQISEFDSNFDHLLESNIFSIIFAIFPSLFGRNVDCFLDILMQMVRKDTNHVFIDLMLNELDFNALLKTGSNTVFLIINEMLSADQSLSSFFLSLDLIPLLTNSLDEGNFFEKITSAQTLTTLIQSCDDNSLEKFSNNPEMVENILDLCTTEIPSENIVHIAEALYRIRNAEQDNEEIQDLFSTYDFDSIIEKYSEDP